MGEEQLGLDLMQSIIHRNLRGKLALRNDDGAVAVIEFTPQSGEEERMRE
jgi:two-component sensor histidine kinase